MVYLEDSVEVGRAGDLASVPIILLIGVPALVAVGISLVAVAVVLVALAHGAGEGREGHEAEDEEVSPHGEVVETELCSEKVEKSQRFVPEAKRERMSKVAP